MVAKDEDRLVTDGLLVMLAGGPLARGEQLEAKHTFCKDCACWVSHSPSDERPGVVRIGRCSVDEHIYEADGPLWPGCRGFKLRDGAPGPAKRVREFVKKQMRELHEREAAAAAQGVAAVTEAVREGMASIPVRSPCCNDNVFDKPGCGPVCVRCGKPFFQVKP